MNTAQRKKEQLKALKETSMINARIKDAYVAGSKHGIYDTVNLMLWTLHTKNGFGQKRLTQLYKDLVYLSDCVIAETLSVDDIVEALAEECGIRVGEVK